MTFFFIVSCELCIVGALVKNSMFRLIISYEEKKNVSNDVYKEERGRRQK